MDVLADGDAVAFVGVLAGFENPNVVGVRVLGFQLRAFRSVLNRRLQFVVTVDESLPLDIVQVFYGISYRAVVKDILIQRLVIIFLIEK